MWIVVSVSPLALPLRRGIRLYSERRRVMHQYVEGPEIEPVRTDLMEQMEGGTRREFQLGYIGACSATTLAAAAAWVSTTPNTFWPWAAVTASVLALWFSADAIHSYAKRIALNPPPHAVEV